MEKGIVYFVGGGPGHPGLITLRGVECLRRADAVLYDYLANSQLLCHASPDAERICLGRHGRSKIWSQAAINEELVRRARDGQCVVRLKGGDPTIFGRASEEVAVLRAANLLYEIVPGVTAGSAASAYAGVFVTDREQASAVAFVTGHERLGKPESAVDYRSLAAFPGTLVIYMGVQTAKEWAPALIQAGKSPDTPVLAVRRVSWPDQQAFQCSLDELATTIEATQLRPPVVFVVGPAAGRDRDANWFDSLPLRGQTILITRPRHQATELMRRFGELGAYPVPQPAIAIREPDDPSQCDEVLQRLPSFDMIVFSSANGVHAFMKRLRSLGWDARRLANAKLATIGPRTAEALRTYQLVADFQPSTYRAEALGDLLSEETRGQHCLLVQASRGRDVLAPTLREHGAEVEQIVAYLNEDVTELDDDVKELLEAGEIDWITMTSSAIARSCCQLLGEQLRSIKIASISPLTSQTLRELGFEPTVEAVDYTTEGIVAAILASMASRDDPR